MFTTNEARTALALHGALRPRLNPDAFRSATAESIALHGQARHDILKVAAMHASRPQLTAWKQAA